MVANREHPPFSKYPDPPQNAYIFFTQFFCFPFYWTPSARRLLQKKRVCPSVLLSFHSSFHLSVSFLVIGSLVFSENLVLGVLGVHIWHGVKGPYIVACGSRIFWKKSPSGKNGQKWPKNMVFGLFKKTMSLVLSEICVK